MHLPTLAVKRPITTAMLLVSVLVVGGIAIQQIPLAYLPEVDVPFIMVQIPYPNANPQQVEREIVKPDITRVAAVQTHGTHDIQRCESGINDLGADGRPVVVHRAVDDGAGRTHLRRAFRPLWLTGDQPDRAGSHGLALRRRPGSFDRHE